MYRIVAFVAVFTLALSFVLFTARNAQAVVSYTLLVGSDGPFNRGDNVPFTIDIHTAGARVTNPITGISFDSTKLQFVSAAPGDAAFDTVTVQDAGEGKKILSGTSVAGFTGDTTFVSFSLKIIAPISGETDICTIFRVDLTPTPTVPQTLPSQTPIPSCIPRPTNIALITPSVNYCPVILPTPTCAPRPTTGQLVAGINYCPAPTCVPAPANDGSRLQSVNYCPKVLPRSGNGENNVLAYGALATLLFAGALVSRRLVS